MTKNHVNFGKRHQVLFHATGFQNSVKSLDLRSTVVKDQLLHSSLNLFFILNPLQCLPLSQMASPNISLT